MTEPIAKTESNISYIIRGHTRNGARFDINTQTGNLTLPRNMNLGELMDVAAAFVKHTKLARLNAASPEEVIFGPFEELIRSMSLNPTAAAITTSEAEGQ